MARALPGFALFFAMVLLAEFGTPNSPADCKNQECDEITTARADIPVDLPGASCFMWELTQGRTHYSLNVSGGKLTTYDPTILIKEYKDTRDHCLRDCANVSNVGATPMANYQKKDNMKVPQKFCLEDTSTPTP